MWKQHSLNSYSFIFLGCVVMILVYLFSYHYNQSFQFSIIGFIILVLSMLITSISLLSMYKKGLNSYNIFFLTFFFFLMLNTLNVSNLQSEKTITHLYYFFIGPLIFGLCLFIAEGIKINTLQNKIVLIKNPEHFVKLLLTIYILLWIYIYTRTGIRLFSSHSLSVYSNLYIIPGISGIVAMLYWILLVYSPHVSFRWQIIIYSTVILFNGILNIKRGDIVRTLIFIGIYYLIINRDKVFSIKTIMKTSIFVIILVSIFTFAGEYRQSLRMGDSGVVFDINTTLQSNINNDVFSWIYSYSAINFDVLGQNLNRKPTLSLDSILLPFYRVVKGNSFVEDYYKELNTTSLRGFNASTFLLGYIRDLGPFYIFELILLGLIVGAFVVYFKNKGYLGSYTLVLMLIGLSFFGDYFMIPNNFIAVIISTVLLNFTRIMKNEVVF